MSAAGKVSVQRVTHTPAATSGKSLSSTAYETTALTTGDDVMSFHARREWPSLSARIRTAAITERTPSSCPAVQSPEALGTNHDISASGWLVGGAGSGIRTRTGRPGAF